MSIPKRAWRAIEGSGPPTAPIGLRALRSGMDDVTATVLRVAAAYGLISCHVDITFTSITVSYEREGAVPLTAVRIVNTTRDDYTRLQGITDVARAEILAGPDDRLLRDAYAAVSG